VRGAEWPIVLTLSPGEIAGAQVEDDEGMGSCGNVTTRRAINPWPIHLVATSPVRHGNSPAQSPPP
jgi:hypothetical protein